MMPHGVVLHIPARVWSISGVLITIDFEDCCLIPVVDEDLYGPERGTIKNLLQVVGAAPDTMVAGQSLL